MSVFWKVSDSVAEPSQEQMTPFFHHQFSPLENTLVYGECREYPAWDKNLTLKPTQPGFVKSMSNYGSIGNLHRSSLGPFLFPFYSPIFLNAHCSFLAGECSVWFSFCLKHSIGIEKRTTVAVCNMGCLLECGCYTANCNSLFLLSALQSVERQVAHPISLFYIAQNVWIFFPVQNNNKMFLRAKFQLRITCTFRVREW